MASHVAGSPPGREACPASPRLATAAPASLGVPVLSAVLLSLLLLLFLLRLWRGPRRHRQGFPPGPWALPLVGNLLSLGEQPHETLTEMAAKHGPVFSVWLATIPAVVVCGYEAVRECLQLRATDFADRPCLPLFQRLTGMRGLLNARFGPGWAEQRRLAVWSVHAFGTARPDFESLLQEECAHLLQAMDKAFEAADGQSSSFDSSSAVAAAASDTASSAVAAAAAAEAECDLSPADGATSSAAELSAVSASAPAMSSSSSCHVDSAAVAVCASTSHFRASSDSLRQLSSAPPPSSSSPPPSSSSQPSSSPPPPPSPPPSPPSPPPSPPSPPPSPQRDPNTAAAAAPSSAGIDVGPLITNAVSNITNLVIFGERFAYGDSEFEGMVHMFSENVALAASAWAFLYNAFPAAVGALPFGAHRRLFANAERVRLCLVSLTDKFSRGRLPGKPRHMVDAYLDQVDAAAAAEARVDENEVVVEEQEEETSRSVAAGSAETVEVLSRLSSSSSPPSSSPPSSSPPPPPPPASSFTRDNMIFTIGELFIAGTETSSNTLRWAILYMCVYPELQDELHAEVSRALCGETRALRLSDRARTPLLEASLHEVMRHATIAPLGIFRAAARDARLAGFTVPRGTLVVANLHSAHRDPRAWDRADEFRPRRFLDADGRFVRRKEFVAFSIGRRHCVGEKLALMELFLFLGSMLHRYRFSLAGGGTPDLRPRLGFTLQPRPYRVCATRR